MLSPAVAGMQANEIQQNCGSKLLGGSWWYNTKSGQYVSSEGLSPVKGYWVEMESSCTFTVQGQKVNTPLDLSPGWNMISASGSSFTLSSIEAVCGAGSVGENAWAWSPSNGNYVSSQRIETDKGYWLKMSSACSFDPAAASIPDTPSGGDTDSGSTVGPFKLLSVDSADSASVRINGEKHTLIDGAYDWSVEGDIRYVFVNDIIQTNSEEGRGVVMLEYYTSNGRQITTLSNQEKTISWEGWTYHTQPMEDRDDNVKTVRAGENAVIDSGNDGYCGRAFFEKKISVNDGDTDVLDIDYHVEADNWGGKAAVWVDGQARKSINPSGEEPVSKSGTWSVSLESGEHMVRFGIEDSSKEHCVNFDHSMRLKVTEISVTGSE